MRELIISADDLGLTKHNTDTIFESVDHGAVTSVSVLANGLAFTYAMAELQKRPRVRVAVHLNLTEGVPLSPLTEVSRLTRNGRFVSSRALCMRYVCSSRAHRARMHEEIRAEISRQVRRVKEYYTGTLFVDGHQHVHLLPFVFGELLTVAEAEGVAGVRLIEEPLHIVPGTTSISAVSHLIGRVIGGILSRRARRRMAVRRFSANRFFVGVSYSGRMSHASAYAGLSAVMREGEGDTEILFHPGVAEASEVTAWSGACAWHLSPLRDAERAYVMSESARTLFSDFRNNILRAGPDIGKLFRYSVAGTIAAIVHLGALYFFTEHTSLWYVHANVVAFGLGLMVSFVLQKFWTFADHRTDRIHHQALIYTVMQVVSLGINTGGLYLLVQYAHMWYLLAEFILLVLVAVGNFFISSKVIFKKHGHA